VVVAIDTSTRALSRLPQSEWGLAWKSTTGRISQAALTSSATIVADAPPDPWYRGPLTIAAPFVGVPPRQAYVQTNYPPPEYDDSSLTTIWTDRASEVVEFFLPVLRAEAASSFAYVTRVQVEGFVDPEEEFEQISITQWVQLNPEQALDYWDHLGLAIQERTDLLPDYLAELASERVAIRVAWEDSEHAF
jgi:hypothetical protein